MSNSRNTIKNILERLSKDVPIATENDIAEVIRTQYPSCDVPRKEKNIVLEGVEMTVPLCTSQETKKMLIRDKSPLLEIYKDLDRGDILVIKEAGDNDLLVTNLSIKEEYRKPFKIEKLDIVKGNYNIIRRRSIDLIKTLERLEI